MLKTLHRHELKGGALRISATYITSYMISTIIYLKNENFSKFLVASNDHKESLRRSNKSH